MWHEEHGRLLATGVQHPGRRLEDGFRVMVVTKPTSSPRIGAHHRFRLRSHLRVLDNFSAELVARDQEVVQLTRPFGCGGRSRGPATGQVVSRRARAGRWSKSWSGPAGCRPGPRCYRAQALAVGALVGDLQGGDFVPVLLDVLLEGLHRVACLALIVTGADQLVGAHPCRCFGRRAADIHQQLAQRWIGG